MNHSKPVPPKKKRILAAAGIVALGFGIIGTIAYCHDSVFFANIFKLDSDVSEFVETFDSPDNWQPCQEIPKTAIATNKNDSPRYVRMKINEYWREKDTQTPITDHETTDLPLTWMDSGIDKHYAVINTQNDGEWELKSDGWYYYKTALNKDQSTLSLLKSVTFNCEVNTAGEIRYSADGLSGESMPDSYAGATYHLYITFQMSNEEFAVEKQRLYSTIASLSTNTNYGSNDKVDGVNKYGASENDDYPIYYYRGVSAENNVIFADKCWKIVRTAEGGATKMVYNGVPNGSKCEATGDDAVAATNVKYATDIQKESSNYYQTYYVENFSYMLPQFTSDFQYITPLDATGGCNNLHNSTYCSQYVYFGNDVSWNEETGKYTLVKTYRTTRSLSNNENSDDNKKLAQGYRYSCIVKNTTSCETVYYMATMGDKNWFHLIQFKHGKKLEDWKNEIFVNTNDNNIKTFVDTWFEDNIGNNADKVADVVYCNDRAIKSGPLLSKDASTRLQLQYWHVLFGFDDNESMDCEQENDRFTVDSANGNGALKYPVAILTADEVAFANGALNNDATSSYTMTPSFLSAGNSNQWGGVYCLSDSGPSSVSCSAVRPVLALKYDTFVAGGAGTATNPYTLDWE